MPRDPGGKDDPNLHRSGARVYQLLTKDAAAQKCAKQEEIKSKVVPIAQDPWVEAQALFKQLPLPAASSGSFQTYLELMALCWLIFWTLAVRMGYAVGTAPEPKAVAAEAAPAAAKVKAAAAAPTTIEEKDEGLWWIASDLFASGLFTFLPCVCCLQVIPQWPKRRQRGKPS